MTILLPTRCEIMAILSTIQFIYMNPDTTQNTINIYSDSKITLRYIKMTTLPKYQNIKILIEIIFKILTLIQHHLPLLKINFQKVKSHSNIKGNDIIDKYVNRAAKQVKLNKSNYHLVSYQVTLTQILDAPEHGINETKKKSTVII